MTPAWLLGLGAALCWGISGFLGGLQSRHLSALTVALWSQVAGTTALALVLLPRGEAPALASIAWGIAAGLVGTIGQLLFYRGLAVGLMSIVAPVSACGTVVPVVVALGRGEVPGELDMFGLLAVMAAILLISLRAESSRSASNQARTGAGWALGAALAFGTFFVLLDQGSAGPGAAPAWTVAGARVTLLMSLLALSVLRPGSAQWPGRRLGVLAAIGLADTSGTVLFAYASTWGNLGVVAVLGSLYPAVVVLLGRLVLAERLTSSQQVAVALAMAGIALLAAG